MKLFSLNILLLILTYTCNTSVNAQDKYSDAYNEVYRLMSVGVSYDKTNIDSFYYWNEYSMTLARTKFINELSGLEMDKLSASYYNNKAVYWGQKGYVKKALTFMDTSIRFAKEVDNDTMMATYYNNIGTMYQDQGDVFNAEKSHLLSLEIRSRIGDSSLLGNSYNNIGYMYYRQGMHEKALGYFQLSLSYYKNLPLINSCIPTLNIAVLYKDKGELDSFMVYNSKVYGYAIQESLDGHFNVTLLNAGYYYYMKNRLDTALVLVRSSLEFFKMKKSKRHLSLAYVYLSKIHLKNGNYIEALLSAELANNHTKNLEVIQYHERVYKVLYDAHLALGNGNKAVKYLNLYYVFKDSSQNKKFIQDALYKENQLIFKFEKDSINHVHEAQLIVAEEKLSSEKQYKIFVSIGIFGLVLLSVMLIRNYYLKQKLAKENFEKEQLSNEYLIEELRTKSKKLMGSYVKELKSQKSFQEIEKLIEEAGRMSADEIHQSVNQIKNELRAGKVSSKKIEKFQSNLTLENEGLTSYLKNKYDDLTPKELRLCVLLKMNYSTDEICSVLGIAATTLKSSRYRIHKKMNIEKGVRLQDYLINLS